MKYPIFFDAKNSSNLFGFEKEFKLLNSLYKNLKLPKILLLSGDKGLGKSTLVNHFLLSIFDEKNYDKEFYFIKNTSSVFSQFKNNIFPNIIYVQGSNFNTAKIDDIRNLKKEIFQSTIIHKDRFIIFDDIELLNKNTLNALLKIIEEPSDRNYFILINNKAMPLLETIKSRSLEFKLYVNEKNRKKVIDQLIGKFKIETILDQNKYNLSPGNFIKYDYIFNENNIQISDDIMNNLSILLKLYKKEREILFVNIAFFIVDYYFKDLSDKKSINNDKIYENKNFIIKSLNNFLLHNINHNNTINVIANKLNYG
tara:strand:+ start:12781 stop:13716 length:936 start_codon:yes stop_codon:yes gene_type:complete